MTKDLCVIALAKKLQLFHLTTYVILSKTHPTTTTQPLAMALPEREAFDVVRT
jgi:hypothetical protein